MANTLKKHNILFVIPQLDRGGSETLIYDIATRLNKELFDVSLAYFYFYGNEKFKQAFQDQSVKMYQIQKVDSADFSAMRTMARIIHENDIHLVNAHHFISMVYSFYACKIAGRRRLVYTEHSSWEVGNVPLKWKMASRLLSMQLDCVIGVSDEITKTLKENLYLRDQGTLTIRNGVDLNGNNNPRDTGSIRKEFGLSEKTKVVATVANLRKVKNHLLLLEGFRELLGELDKVKLLLIGQGYAQDPESSEDEVRRYIEEHALSGKVILTGYRSDVKDLLSIADVFCLTSFREGLPISMLEAMSCSLPVIGTNVPGIREVVLNGKNGFLVELGDPIAIKDALLSILTNDELSRNLGSESRKIALESYSLDQCAKSYQDLFLRLLKH
jgi:L-malate glycosyltransferase